MKEELLIDSHQPEWNIQLRSGIQVSENDR